MVEAYEATGGVEEDRHAVEAQLGTERAVGRFGEPGDGHAADLGALDEVEVLPGFAGVGATGLDLGEHEGVAVEAHQVELAEARPVVAGEDLEAEALEVSRRDLLAFLARGVPDVGHGGRSYGER